MQSEYTYMYYTYIVKLFNPNDNTAENWIFYTLCRIVSASSY